MTTAAQRLGDFIATAKIEQVPENVRRAAKAHVLDTLGCGLAGYAVGEGDYAYQAVRESGVTGPATVIGASEGLPPLDAAFVNGTLSHVLDFDDTHPAAVVHVSAGVVPAAIAAAQTYGASGADLLTAIVAGNETSVRLGAAAGGLFHARGFHPTGVCGVFGATAAAARIRGLDGAATAHALGIAGSMASGIMEFLADGAQTKPLHPGWVAQAGLAAVRLAAHGATGPSTVFEGARGFFATYLHGAPYDLDTQLADLGDRWVTPDIAFKPYPACHYTHASVDALAQILAQTPLRPDDVERITALVHPTGESLVCAPAEDKVTPRTPYDAKFSLPYCLAYRLVHGRLDVTSFMPDAVTDADVLALTPRVDHEVRQYSTFHGRPSPESFGGGVRITTSDGRVLEAELRYQRGGTENPMTEADVRDKFRTNAGLALSSAEVDDLERAVLGLDGEPDADFATVLRKAARMR